VQPEIIDSDVCDVVDDRRFVFSNEQTSHAFIALDSASTVLAYISVARQVPLAID
jgi:hypothetical protein